MNVWSTDKIDYFLKLRFGDFCGPSVLIPDHLKQIGVKNIILSIATQTEELGPTVQSQSFQHILCYADMHGWNLYFTA